MYEWWFQAQTRIQSLISATLRGAAAPAGRCNTFPTQILGCDMVTPVSQRYDTIVYRYD